MADKLSDKRLARIFQEVRESRDPDGNLRLQLREMAFAHLVAVEGMSQIDAYIESHKPTTTDKDSLYVMSSRVAHRPRVKNEIERLLREASDDKLKREEKLAVALDGDRVRARIAVELYAIGTSPSVQDSIRIKALLELGKMKHVDAFVNSLSTAQLDKPVGFGIRADQDASAAKEALTETIKKLIGSRAAAKTIEVQPIAEVEDKIE